MRARSAALIVLGLWLVLAARAPQAHAAPPTAYKCGKGGKAQKKKHACKCPKGKVTARDAKDAAVCVAKPKAGDRTEARTEDSAAKAAGTETQAPPEIVHDYEKEEIDLVDMRKQLRRKRDHAEACYSTRLTEHLAQYPDPAKRPKFEGIVRVLFEVESSGVPRRISVVPPPERDETALHDDATGACLVRALERGRLRFKVRREGRFQFAFEFKPAEPW